MISSSESAVSVLTITNQSFRLLLLRTYTNFAGIHILRSKKQTVANRHKGVPVWPAKGGGHPETETVFHRTVVEDPCKQFRLFRARAIKQAVVNKEDILALFIRQEFHETVDDVGRKQCCEISCVFHPISSFSRWESSGIIQREIYGHALQTCTKIAPLYFPFPAPFEECFNILFGKSWCLYILI